MLFPNTKAYSMRSSLSSTLQVNVFNQFKTTQFSLDWLIFLNFRNILAMLLGLIKYFLSLLGLSYPHFCLENFCLTFCVLFLLSPFVLGFRYHSYEPPQCYMLPC